MVKLIIVIERILRSLESSMCLRMSHFACMVGIRDNTHYKVGIYLIDEYLIDEYLIDLLR